MSRQVNIREAEAKLSRLVEDAARGEEVVIAKNGRPIAKLTAFAPVAPRRAKDERA
ncbi:MAG: type II toxin-antitoxin system prevent-host-death family antitoxin [Alphaproteobacteria bacterium]|nr:type II toxin-antitoxin system prevent-host-death family antitoxin [Alphaproteobacteria bacterium]